MLHQGTVNLVLLAVDGLNTGFQRNTLGVKTVFSLPFVFHAVAEICFSLILAFKNKIG